MRKLIIFLTLILPLNSYSQIKNGYFYAKVPINKKENSKCFYEKELFIRNDSVYFITSPKCIVNKDTCDASADHGYSGYAGLISKNGHKMYISIYLTRCEYCIYVDLSDTTYIPLGLTTYRLYKKGDYLIFYNVKLKCNPDKIGIIKGLNFKELFIRNIKEQVGIIDEPNKVIEN